MPQLEDLPNELKLQIDTDGLDLGTPFQIPDRDRKKTEQWIDDLLMPYVAANSVTPAIPYDPEAREKWRGAFFALNPLDALLAYIAAKSANLESLKLDLCGYFQTPSVAELLYYKIRADLQCKRAPFPKLRHLQIGSVLDIAIPVFALSELRQLQICFLDDDSPLEIPVFENNNLSHLHVLDLYYIKDATMVEAHTADIALKSRLPAYLESIRLIFDFDVISSVSLKGKLHLVEPVLHALKAKLNAEGVALGISVRRIGDIEELYDEHYMGDGPKQVYDH
ncbi:hypothetical protein J3E72DRAFT_273830 [Bipolaris maydis]|nr:hypothetical protein J3E72DRAFT_273830 [Bipolaris maydis]